ncbi:uncharacterized protein LOC129796400 [Lutzomyia longipalpis]|uniref:uncharacterized protein LOC129796400 n=1 Tax=Lutzomyia longipalpis TaxID=7200 RepID=UPI002483F065|nr:uncharacterized protein LOC129796400 [Lutzomyia longipalpis]
MPLCAYFVSGKCSYGNKCHNSHVDVQQMVQTEMKAAIHGKQWPLSCFSPFKDEPSLPDLIEDQSFEEIRFNFYLAKMENRLPQFQEEFKRITGIAFEKMSKLMLSDPAVKNYLIDIFGINGKRSRQVKSGGTFANTFGSGDTGGGGKSIFDRISSNVSTEAPQSAFGAPTGSSFGGASSIFGGQSSFAPQAAPQKSIFGQQQSVFASQQSQSIFGQSQQTNSFFKLPQLGAPQAASGGNIFAQSSFGAPPSAPASAFPAATNNSIFGSGGFSNTQPMSTESIFGGGGNTGGSFGQQNSAFGQTPSSQFGQSVLAPPSFAAPPQSVFGQPQQMAQQSQPMQQAQDGGFGQMMMQQQPNMQQVQQPHGNLQQTPFGVQQAPPQSVFGNVNATQQPQQQQPVSSVFTNPSPFAQSNQPPPSVPRMNPPAFGAPPPSQPPAAQLAHFYSKIDELTPQDLEAFKADAFELGKIPTMPPPIELCSM